MDSHANCTLALRGVAGAKDPLALLSVDFCHASVHLSRTLPLICSVHGPTTKGCPTRGHCLVGSLLSVLKATKANLWRRARSAARRAIAAKAPVSLAALASFVDGASSVNSDTPACDLLEEAAGEIAEGGTRCHDLYDWALFCARALAVGVQTLRTGFVPPVTLDASLVEWPSVRPGFAFAPAEVLAQIIVEERLATGVAPQSPGIRMVEVGVRSADTSVGLLSHFPSLHTLLVDPYEFNEDPTSTERASRRMRLDAIAQTRVYHDRAVQLFEPSTAAAPKVNRSSIDIVFIDADHSYEHCRQDILAWWPKVRAGGVLAGHDYHMTFPGVVRAVNEFAASSGHQLKLSSGVWWVLKPADLASQHQQPRKWSLRHHIEGLSVVGGRRWVHTFRKVAHHPPLVKFLVKAFPQSYCWQDASGVEDTTLKNQCCGAFDFSMGGWSPEACPDLLECCRPYYMQVQQPDVPPVPRSVPPARRTPLSRVKLAALVLTGQQRSLLTELESGETVVENIRRNLFAGTFQDAFDHDGLEGSGLDVLWLLDTREREGEPKVGDTSICEPLRPTCSRCSLFCHVVKEEELDLSGIPPSVMNKTWQDRVQSIFYTILTFRRAYQLLERHMREEGFSYEWLARVRPDVVFLQPTPPLSALPRGRIVTVGTPWAPDLFAVGRAEAMRVYLRAADALNQSSMLYRITRTWVYVRMDFVQGGGGYANIWGTEEYLNHWMDMNGMFLHPRLDIRPSVCRHVRGQLHRGFSNP